MLISIVTGTFNRLKYLQEMIASARGQLVAGIDREFVVVDGGSTDGTLEWCKAQPDVRLIEHGKLLGAIKAFCDGARAARGKYVLLANDDVIFEGVGIMRAIRHLETAPRCGAVAFADDRTAPGYESGFKVQVMSALAADGRTKINVPYAQVGLYRRWLGNLAGWWGDQDAIMRTNRTYGGDNYLSARIWAMGYTVDAIEGVQVRDLVAPDELRRQNVEEQKRIGSLFYQCFPMGVVLNSETHLVTQAIRDTLSDPPALRILMATLFEPGFGRYKRGLREAFTRVGLTAEVDYLQTPELLVALAAAWRPHLIWTQMIDPALMARLRAASPESVIVNWYGDVYEAQLKSERMLAQARHIDLQLVVNADVLPFYAERGIRAAYWQIGFEPINVLPDMHFHDVVFLANCYSSQRLALGMHLQSLPYNVGLYGRGWPDADGETLYAFERGASLYRRAKIAIGDNQYGDKGFVSNRMFEALAHGAFLLQQRVPGLQSLTGLQDGVHYVEWTDFDDLRTKIDYYLAHEAEAFDIAAAGEAFVHEHHTFDVRVRELFALIEEHVREPAPA